MSEGNSKTEIFGVGLENAFTGGASTQDLAAGGAGGAFFGRKSSLEAFLGIIGVVSENIVDFGDGFEAGERQVNIMTIFRDGEGSIGGSGCRGGGSSNSK